MVIFTVVTELGCVRVIVTYQASSKIIIRFRSLICAGGSDVKLASGSANVCVFGMFTSKYERKLLPGSDQNRTPRSAALVQAAAALASSKPNNETTHVPFSFSKLFSFFMGLKKTMCSVSPVGETNCIVCPLHPTPVIYGFCFSHK
jgi:hypothetical protein